jgi:hypothetical protein
MINNEILTLFDKSFPGFINLYIKNNHIVGKNPYPNTEI